MRRLLVTASAVPSSPILVTLMMGALSSSETSVLARVTLRNIPENAILHSHRCENLKSNILLVCLQKLKKLRRVWSEETVFISQVRYCHDYIPSQQCEINGSVSYVIRFKRYYAVPQERYTLNCNTCIHFSNTLCFEEWRLLGCYAVWLLQELTFRRNRNTRASVTSYC
jgi:hypothetical protein